MVKTYRIFISSTKKNMSKERSLLINSILMNHCHPVTMEYFVNSNNTSSLTACVDAIDESDAVILMVKDNYGELIHKYEIENTFQDGCPLYKNGSCKCSDGNTCKYSYTHFEYLYSCLYSKVVYVLVHDSLFLNNDSQSTFDFMQEAKQRGGYNVYSDENFGVVSSAVISGIKSKCESDELSGLVSAKYYFDLINTKNKLYSFEKNYMNGFVPIKNYMGCIIQEEDLVFYVYKELNMLESKQGFDFSIHINTEQADFKDKLTKDFIQAHAYVRYSKKEEFSGFFECNINERSYGREYLNCHIDFVNKNNQELPISKEKTIGVLYTYKVTKKLYGNEIGRKTSPFLEETLVELGCCKENALNYQCMQKVNNKYRLIDFPNDSHPKVTNNSFLENILKNHEEFNHIFNNYFSPEDLDNIKYVNIPVSNMTANIKDELVHFYVRWED